MAVFGQSDGQQVAWVFGLESDEDRVAKGYWVDRGKLNGPDGCEEQDLKSHLEKFNVIVDLGWD